MKALRSGNPLISDRTFAQPDAGSGVMTVQGTATKTLVLLLLAVAGAATIWDRAITDPQSSVVSIGMWGGLIGGFIVAMITAFKPAWSPITAPLYALLEGVFLGAISALFESMYPGIAIQAVALTFGTLFVLLVLYKAGVIRATPAFRKGVMAATGAIALVYLISMGMSFFGSQMPLLHDATPMGIGISLVIVTVAALNLVLDFDLIEQGAASGAPKHMEWYGAFALMVTLVWLYLEMLRLLAKLQDRR